MNGNNVIYFGSFGVEPIPKISKKKHKKQKYHKKPLQKIQAYNPITCGYFCTGFIDFMLKGKNLLDYTNSFSSNEHEKNEKIILKYFQ